MRGLPFVKSFFTNVLERSRTIEGRLVYCARQGAEVNMDEFDQVIKQAFDTEFASKKRYPVCLMMPPRIKGDFTTDGWDGYQFTLFFLTSTFYDDEGTKDMNPDTATSTHTILADQAEMMVAAENFIAVVDQVAHERALIRDQFRPPQRSEKLITPVALIGNDRLSGVRLDFDATIYNDCLIEDYTQEGINSIVIPPKDPDE